MTLLLAGNLQADVIKPNDVRATSQFGVGLNIQNLVNGDQGAAIGLTDFGLKPAGGPGVLDDAHGVVVGGTVDQWGWISGCSDGGIPGGSSAEVRGADCSDAFADPGGFSTEPVDDQIIEFELDGAYDLSAAHIWNDNEDGFAPDRGLDEFEIQVSSERTGDNFTPIGTTYNLTADSGFDPNFAQVIPLVASGVRRVRLLLNSAHFDNGGVDQYVGLSEVRFEGTLDTLDLAADSDKDGDTDGADFLKWQFWRGLGELDNADINPDSLNSTLTATQSRGDYDNNNVSNADDLTVWSAEFGGVAPAAASVGVAIPEPSSLLLVATAALGSFLAIRRRLGQKLIH